MCFNVNSYHKGGLIHILGVCSLQVSKSHFANRKARILGISIQYRIVPCPWHRPKILRFCTAAAVTSRPARRPLATGLVRAYYDSACLETRDINRDHIPAFQVLSALQTHTTVWDPVDLILARTNKHHGARSLIWLQEILESSSVPQHRSLLGKL
jgi:hypothetical protein